MPVDFDDADIADVVEEVNSPQAQFLPAQVQPEVDIEEQMSEVEARLEIAKYYQLLLNESLFDDAPNPDVAERVESEIRGFVKTRMQALMGVAQPEQKAQKIFTDAEVQALRTLAQSEVVDALKALAAKVLKKPAILDAKPLPAEKPKRDEPTREPALRKVRRAPNNPTLQGPSPAPRQAPNGRSRQLRPQLQTNVNAKGEEFVQDVTPQARPVGTIQPIPTPRGRDQIEAMAAQSAAHQARVAMNTLENKLRGKE